jgi:hypothetical protein
VKVLRAADEAGHATRFAPAQLPGLPRGGRVRRPQFLAIVALVDLAAGLAAQPATRPDGFVIEGPTARGHNAPPCGAWHAQSDPSYGARDHVDVAAIAAIGLPFWLAGSYGSPEGLRAARRAVPAASRPGLCSLSVASRDLRPSSNARSFASSPTARCA